MALISVALWLLTGVTMVMASCPAGTVQGLRTDLCYEISEDVESWATAEQTCVTNGGHLASVTSDVTSGFFQSTVSFVNSYSYWIGGYKDVVESKWVWSDGSRWSYTDWAVNSQPDSQTNNCVLFNATNGQWYPTTCASVQPYICRVPPLGGYVTHVPLPPSLPTPWPPQKCFYGGFSVPSSDLCYSVSSYPATWNDASISCSSFPSFGRLASITSSALQAYLLTQVFYTCNQYNGCWIGLSYNGNTYQWMDGSPLNYTNWAPNSPQGPYQGVILSAMNNGEWADYQVSYYFAYICEYAPIM
jgi:hypothetical protein